MIRKIYIKILINTFYRIKWFKNKEIKCYVDSEIGNDNNLGFVREKPIKSLEIVFNRIPKVIKYPTYVFIKGSFDGKELYNLNKITLKNNLIFDGEGDCLFFSKDK